MDTLTARRRLAAALLPCLLLIACGGAASGSPTAALSPSPAAPAAPSDTPGPNGSAPADSTAPGESQAPETGGGTTSGDVPDNAVFLTDHQATLHFSIQYVEGWQVTTQPDGVVIHDKDSSETVKLVDLPSDVGAWISSTDVPSLMGQAGFKLIKQDRVKVGGATDDRLVYHILSPADPVTGKQVPSTVDRYYVPGSTKLAIVSLSTPDGVDNVDAFRQMIESFRWQ